MIPKKNLLLCAGIFSCLQMAVESYTYNELETKMINQLMENYTGNQLPPETPVEVEMGMKILGFTGMTPENSDFQVAALFSSSWRDSRLSINTSIDVSGNYSGPVDITFLRDRLWVPRLYFSNSKTAVREDITQENYQVALYQDGTVKEIQRLVVKLHCHMSLFNFPFDTQFCPMYIESMSVTPNQLNLYWGNMSVDKHVHVPEFHRPELLPDECEAAIEGSSCILVTYRLIRIYHYYIFSVYVPFILIVFASFMVFFIDVKAVPARTTLSIVGVMTCMVHMANHRENAEHVGYLRVIDIYGVISLGFTCMAFLESHIAHFWHRTQGVQKPRINKKKYVVNGAVHDHNLDSSVGDESMPEVSSKKRRKSYKSHMHVTGGAQDPKLDKIARVAFPIAFLIFNLVYWVICLVVLNEDDNTSDTV